MRRCLLVMVVSACNQLYDVDETKLVESDEAPVDPQCPAVGAGPPVFRQKINEVTSRNCYSYTTSETTGRAVAMCLSDDSRLVLEEGPIDEPLAPAQIVTNPSQVSMSKAWLAPAGNELLVHHYSSTATGPSEHQLAFYVKQGSGWMWSSNAFTSTEFITAGVPSAGPRRRLFVATIRSWIELELQGSTWVEVDAGNFSDLGSPTVTDNLNLSADGLLLTFTASYTPMYTRRASLDEAFPPAVEIETIGEGRDTFITPNCERAYFSGISSVFFRYLL